MEVLIMFIKKGIRATGINKLKALSALLYGILISNIAFATSYTDPLAESVKPQVEALFGPHSTVAYCVYTAEIIFGSIACIKTKNPMVLVTLPIIVLFTNSMFSYISS